MNKIDIPIWKTCFKHFTKPIDIEFQIWKYKHYKYLFIYCEIQITKYRYINLGLAFRYML